MLGPSLSPELPEKLFYVHVVGPLLVLADEYKRRMSRLEELLRLKDSDIDTIFAEYHVDTEKAKRECHRFLLHGSHLIARWSAFRSQDRDLH